MTKVQKHFRLQRPLDEALMAQIAAANSIYGIENIRILPSREELMVEYDASRLLSATCSFSQLPAPNAAGVSAGHDIFTFHDLPAAQKFWNALGGQSAE